MPNTDPRLTDLEWLTTRQLAALLQLPVRTLYAWRTQHADAPPAVRLGKHLRWRRADVDLWLRRQRESDRYGSAVTPHEPRGS